MQVGQRALVYKINQRSGFRELDGEVLLVKKYNCPNLWDVKDLNTGFVNKRLVYEEDQVESRPVLKVLNPED